MRKLVIFIAVESLLVFIVCAYYFTHKNDKVTDYITINTAKVMKLARNDNYNAKDYKEDFLKTYKDKEHKDSKDLILYPESSELSTQDLQNLEDEDLLLAPPKPKEKTQSNFLNDEEKGNATYKGLYKYPTPDEWNRGIPYLEQNPIIMDMRRFHGY